MRANADRGQQGMKTAHTKSFYTHLRNAVIQNSTGQIATKMIRRLSSAVLLAVLTFSAVAFAHAQNDYQRVVLEHGKSTIVFEPYAPNIIRVTLSLLKDPALAAPGYGFVATPSAQGWSHTQDGVDEVYKSSRMVVTLKGWRKGGTPPPQSVMDPGKYFSGSTPGADITFTTPEGKKIAELNGWSMSVLNHKDGNSQILYDRRPTDPDFYQVGADFASPDDEHYYGLGQNQEGYLDHRGHVVHCWHDYNAPGGQSVCVPFMVTNYGYGIVWDNPSKTTIAPHFNERTSWISRSRRPRLLLRHRRKNNRRNLRRLSPVDRSNAAAAQGGLRIHPVQAALPLAG